MHLPCGLNFLTPTVIIMSTQPSAEQFAPNDSELFRSFDEYPWSTDLVFQNGLKVVLSSLSASASASTSASGPGPSTEEGVRHPSASEIEYKAKSFFYEKNTGKKVDIGLFKAWKKQQQDQLTNSGNSSEKVEEETPFPSKYAAIVELILSGKPVPGIIDVPDTVLGQEASTEAKAQRRRKPWETEQATD